MNPGRTNEPMSLLMCIHLLFQIQQRPRSAPPQSSLWQDQPWSSTPPSFLGGSPFNMSMSEYLNVGSQQSQNSQLNTPPTFPQQSTAPAATGSASQMAVAGSANDDSTGEASSTVDHAAILDMEPCPQKNTNPVEVVE